MVKASSCLSVAHQQSTSRLQKDYSQVTPFLLLRCWSLNDDIQRNSTKKEVLSNRKKEKERKVKIAAEEKEKKAKIAAEEEERKAKTAAAGTSPRPHSIVGGTAHPLSSQPHAAIYTSSATPAVTTTSAGAAAASMTTLPDATMRQAGCWTRFWLWLFLCCTCADSTNGHR
jgi:hypothetical protein